MLVASIPAVPYGKLFYRTFENGKIIALKQSRRNFKTGFVISQKLYLDLQWWLNTIPICYAPVSRGQPDLEIETDASLKGYGFSCEKLGKTSGGPWKGEEGQWHINYLELQAAYFELQSLCSDMKHVHIRLHMDSMTAVSYIREQGGSHSLDCNDIARKLWLWAYERDIWLSSSHISGINNKMADLQSRRFNSDTEWMLDKSIYRQVINTLHFQPCIDMFASRTNCQLNKFVSWKPQPDAFAIDAFTLDWQPYNSYMFPPFSLLPRVLQKLSADKATSVVILPNWPTQTYYATAMNMLIQDPVYIRKSRSLLEIPDSKQIHPLWNKLTLLGCHLSGDQSRVKDYQKKLPTYCWQHGYQPQQNSMTAALENGKATVVNGKLIRFRSL